MSIIESKFWRNSGGKGVFHFWEGTGSSVVIAVSGAAPRVARVPIVRAWLGDKPIERVQYARHVAGFSESDLTRLEKAFPEAEFSAPPLEPCHPGCFPARTLVNTPNGPRLIEDLQVGALVTTFGPNGEAAPAHVQAVFVTSNQIWEIRTDQGSLLTTETQPLRVKIGDPRRAGELKAADIILRYRDGGFVPAVVREVSSKGRTERVFNLILDNGDRFVAGGFLVRSKPPAPLAAH